MSHYMTRREQERLIKLADPQCPDCGGEGFYCIEWNGDPNRDEDVACECTTQTREEDEPESQGHGWGV